MCFTKLLVLGLLPLLLAPAAAQEAGSGDISVAPVGLHAHPGSLRVSIGTDRADATYAIGETARLFVTANEDAYVTVFGIGPTGGVHQLFPNAYQTDNHVSAHQTVEIAGGASGGRIAVFGPAGAELVEVIASSKPLIVVGRDLPAGPHAFNDTEGVDALQRNLEVVGNADADDRKLAVARFTLHTIAARPTAGGAIVIVPARPDPVLMLPVETPDVWLGVLAPQSFALPHVTGNGSWIWTY